MEDSSEAEGVVPTDNDGAEASQVSLNNIIVLSSTVNTFFHKAKRSYSQHELFGTDKHFIS